MKEWTVDELKATTSNALATGPFGSAISSKHFTATGVPVIRGGNLSQDVGVRLNEEGLAFLEPEKAAEFSRSVARRGDLVFTCWGTIDQVGYIDEGASFSEYVVSNKQMKLTPDPNKVDGLYLYYYFSQPTVLQQILDSGIGSSVPGFNLGQLRKMRVRLPSLETQRKVVGQLDALDARIELNRCMSQTLEAMVQAVFKSWFLDQDHGWPTDEWQTLPLDSVAEFLNGLALQKYPANEHGESLPVIKIAQLRAGHTKSADRAGTDVPSAYVINDGDLLFSWSGSLEVDFWCGGRGALNQHLFKVSSAVAPLWYAYLWTKHHLPEFRAIAANKATTMGHIQRKHLTEAEVLLPPPAVLTQMDEVMRPLISQMIQLRLEARTLAELRDELLPKLLSGELSIGAETVTS